MRRLVVLAFVLMFTITVGAGSYSMVLGKSEMLHFRVAFPAGDVIRPMVVKGRGPPIELSPIIVDLDQRGVLRTLVNPDIEAISTHWISNYGNKPVRVRLELVNCTFPVIWEVSANAPYDPETHTFTEPLMPGNSIPNLGIDWIFKIPLDYKDKSVIYDGGLKVIDADTGAVLTFIPIKIVRGETASGGENCCS